MALRSTEGGLAQVALGDRAEADVLHDPSQLGVAREADLADRGGDVRERGEVIVLEDSGIRGGNADSQLLEVLLAAKGGDGTSKVVVREVAGVRETGFTHR